MNRFIKGITISKNNFTNLKEFALHIKGPVHNVIMDKNVVSNSSGAYINVHEGRLMSDIEILNNKITGGKYGITQDEYGIGKLNGLTIKGNKVSYTTKAAIELDQHATPPSNVDISENELTNNAGSLITVPNSIRKSVRNNIIP